MEKRESKRLGSSLRLLVKTSFIVFIGVVLSKVLSYAYRIIIARYYGPEVYGLLSLALMVSGWIIAVASLGFYDGLSRFIPLYRGRKETKRIKYLVRWSFTILTVTSIVSGLALFFLSKLIAVGIFHDPNLVIYLKIFSMVVPFTILANPFLGLLRGYEKISAYSFVFNIAQNIVKVAAIAIIAWLGFSELGVPVSWLIGMIAMAVLAYGLCRYKLPEVFVREKFSQNEKTKVRKELFSYSWPLMFYGVISGLFYWIDSFSIGVYKTALEVGIYNAAVPIVALLLIAPELFMQLFLPMITKEYAKKNNQTIKELSKQVNKWVFIVNLPIFILLIVFPGAALNILFGQGYLAAETALRILAIGSLITSFTSVSNSLLSMAGKSKLILMNIVVACVVNFGLNSLLVPMQSIFGLDNSLGINGAAIATIISLIVFNVMITIEARYYLKVIPFRRKMLNALIAAIISFGLLYYLNQIWNMAEIIWAIVAAIVFVAIYFLLVFIFRGFDGHDLDIIKAFISKARSII